MSGPMGETPPDLDDPGAARRAVGDASLRLMAGAVPKPKMEQLRRTVEQNPSEYPWQVVTQAIVADDVDPQRLVQQGLAAQRDWILRGGRTTRGPSVARRTKGLVARIVAQAVFGLCYALVIVAALLLLKHKLPAFDIYRILTWFQQTFGG